MGDTEKVIFEFIDPKCIKAQVDPSMENLRNPGPFPHKLGGEEAGSFTADSEATVGLIPGSLGVSIHWRSETGDDMREAIPVINEKRDPLCGECLLKIAGKCAGMLHKHMRIGERESHILYHAPQIVKEKRPDPSQLNRI